MPTIYDIAKVANVSKSTVSRVLNNQTNISEDAKKRVLQAIQELNYQPSKLARGLSSGFDAIMVVIRSKKTTENNPFFSDILHTISAKAEEESFDVIVQTSKNSEDERAKCIAKIEQKMIKGIIMLSSPIHEDLYEQLDRYGLPIAVVGKVDGNYLNVFSVDTNNYADSYSLTKHLISKGHKRIACLHSPVEYHVSADRLQGYKECMRDHALPVGENLIVNGGYTNQESEEALTHLLSFKKKPSAIFATDDLKVTSTYKVAAEMQLNIPTDLSIVGFSNSSHTPFLSPSLTTVEIPVSELGQTSSSSLFKRIKGNSSSFAKTLVPTRMVHGDSVRSFDV
ncbi:LacI family DNA-binding transcriptional regulator [Shouchella shacheensis]|uniref:LacI family DNA-binding transcriptional regulator n=1 Tax=Shouchella shacheensis TaxID=1649580 RepID=UPI0007402E73|nr:LacI family DNA-binding transcriptional regulator [Shouchella shacheensis]